MEKKVLTTASGIPVDNDQASISTGMRENGYVLMQDQHTVEPYTQEQTM